MVSKYGGPEKTPVRPMSIFGNGPFVKEGKNTGLLITFS